MGLGLRARVGAGLGLDDRAWAGAGAGLDDRAGARVWVWDDPSAASRPDPPGLGLRGRFSRTVTVFRLVFSMFPPPYP